MNWFKKVVKEITKDSVPEPVKKWKELIVELTHTLNTHEVTITTSDNEKLVIELKDQLELMYGSYDDFSGWNNPRIPTRPSRDFFYFVSRKGLHFNDIINHYAEITGKQLNPIFIKSVEHKIISSEEVKANDSKWVLV